jgi:hypothetical protein
MRDFFTIGYTGRRSLRSLGETCTKCIREDGKKVERKKFFIIRNNLIYIFIIFAKNFDLKYMYNFEKLDVWMTSKQLAVKIYQLIEKFPQEEKFALSNQLRRACISIPSNIAEGSGRISIREKYTS